MSKICLYIWYILYGVRNEALDLSPLFYLGHVLLKFPSHLSSGNFMCCVLLFWLTASLLCHLPKPSVHFPVLGNHISQYLPLELKPVTHYFEINSFQNFHLHKWNCLCCIKKYRPFAHDRFLLFFTVLLWFTSIPALSHSSREQYYYLLLHDFSVPASQTSNFDCYCNWNI